MQKTNNKPAPFTVFVMIALLGAAAIACTPSGQQEFPENPTMTYKTYGGFVMPDHAIREVVVDKDNVVFTIYSSSGSVTEQYSKQLPDGEYDKITGLMKSYNFLQMKNLYEQKKGDPVIADAGNLEISLKSNGQTLKTVKVSPYSYDYMPQGLQMIADEFQSLMEYAQGPIIPNTGLLKYQPVQCVDTPWQEWYSSGVIQFIKEPTDQELITAYYSQKYNITIESAERVDSGLATCQACDVCATSYYFVAEAAQGDAEKLAETGWEILG